MKTVNPKSSTHLQARASPASNVVRNESRSEPTHEQIARRAYEIFLARGGTHGRHDEDWLQAERELRLGR